MALTVTDKKENGIF